jgi:hypothetical protein
VERWAEVARQLGFRDFVTPSDGFRDCVGPRRPWVNSRDPGIYFWIASNGEAYIGQSVSPRSRLRQHLLAHDDITRAAFQRCPREKLDALEAELVRCASKHFPLRNIKLAVSTASHVPFDVLVPYDEQRAFVAGEQLPIGECNTFEQLERLQVRKFHRLLEHALAEEALKSTRLFLSRVMPRPADTEVGFWSATVQPTGRLVRLNCGQQEVFTYEATAGAASVRIFTDARVHWLRSCRSSYQTRSFVTCVRPGTMDRWLAGEALLSCRRLVVQLMRHTQALNSASHCPQLVRRAFDDR